MDKIYFEDADGSLQNAEEVLKPKKKSTEDEHRKPDSDSGNKVQRVGTDKEDKRGTD